MDGEDMDGEDMDGAAQERRLEAGSRAAPCSPLDDATREDVLAMVFDPKMEHASIGIIWERLRRKYGALLPAECLTHYSENAK